MEFSINKKGWTLVELIIVVAILGIIFIPLVRIMHSVLVSWWSGKAKLTIQEDAREILFYITQDLKASKRSTLGSIISNGSFEKYKGDPNNPTIWSPYYWLVSDISDIEYEFTSSTNVVHTGMFSVKIRETASITYSSEISVPYSTSYIFSYWVRASSGNPTVTAEITGAGISLSTSIAAPSSWGQYVSIVTLPQSDELGLRITVQDTTGGLEEVYIDDVSLTPKDAILLHPNSSLINVDSYRYESQTTGAKTELDNFELKIETRKDNKGRTINRLMRYYLDFAGDVTNPVPTTLDYNDIGENIYRMEFKYPQPDSVILSKGKDLPVQIILELRIPMPSGEDYRNYKVTTSIYPVTW